MAKVRWKEVEPILTTLLKDEVATGVEGGVRRRYDPADLVQWWNNGQIRLATMRPLQRHLVYTFDDGNPVSLPDNFYRPRVVLLENNKQQLHRLSIESKFYNPEAVGYAIYEGQLHLLNIRPQRWLLAYEAYYSAIKNETSIVETPVWAYEACAVYAAMEAITREMIADSRYRKFIGKQDAGNPQQSPFLPVARWLEERFNAIVAAHSDDDEDYQQ